MQKNDEVAKEWRIFEMLIQDSLNLTLEFCIKFAKDGKTGNNS